MEEIDAWYFILLVPFLIVAPSLGLFMCGLLDMSEFIMDAWDLRIISGGRMTKASDSAVCSHSHKHIMCNANIFTGLECFLQVSILCWS